MLYRPTHWDHYTSLFQRYSVRADRKGKFSVSVRLHLPGTAIVRAYGTRSGKSGSAPVRVLLFSHGGTLGTIAAALGLVAAAYMAETIRAGIQAVPRGQTEAARSLGMSPGWAMVSIVLPQAFRIILPPLTNELILLTKDSSLVYLLGLTLEDRELAQFSRDALNQYVSMTPILVAGLCYLLITVPLSYVVRRLEAKAAQAR